MRGRYRGLLMGDGESLSVRLGAPDDQGTIGGDGQRATAGGERQAADESGDRRRPLARLARLQVEQAHAALSAADRQEAAVGADGNGIDGPHVLDAPPAAGRSPGPRRSPRRAH